MYNIFQNDFIEKRSREHWIVHRDFFSKDKKDCLLKYCVNESLYYKQDFAHAKWNDVFFLHGTLCTMAQHLGLPVTGFDRHTAYCWLQVKTVIQEVSGFAG